MKRVILLLLCFVLVFVFSDRVLAICNDAAINNWAENAKIIAVEDQEMDIYDESGELLKTHKKNYHYLLLVYPYADLIYAKVKDSESKNEYIVKPDPDFKTVAIGSKIHSDKKKYTITIYAGSQTACPNEVLKTLTYVANPYNKYMTSDFCIKNPGDEKCLFNSDAGTMTESEFKDYTSKQIESNELENMSWIAKTWFYIKKYWYFVILPVILISIFYGILFYIEKKRVK